MIKISGVQEELFKIKNWVCDLLVLYLNSADTVYKILNLTDKQEKNCSYMFNLFSCVHI